MTIRLIHVQQLVTLYLSYGGSNINLGSFGVIRVKGHFHLKML